jgi:hypothetical protein
MFLARETTGLAIASRATSATSGIDGPADSNAVLALATRTATGAVLTVAILGLAVRAGMETLLTVVATLVTAGFAGTEGLIAARDFATAAGLGAG